MLDERNTGTRLIRSIAHRLAGDPVDLPDEGRLGSFERATGWVNSPPLTAESLIGRVVLVDFWTYTCVNWLRTLPYLRAWDEKYRDAGLTIIGVHTPEFGFEHDAENVITQVRELGVGYPVALDNDYGVWNEFANHYWPAVYLADAAGRLRYHHFGEGEYARTEMVIQQLLTANGAEIDMDLVDVQPTGLEVAADWSTLRSPETYLGSAQSSGFDEDRAPFDLPLNHWSLTGAWKVRRDAAVLEAPGGRIAFRFHSRDVNLVMGPVAPGVGVSVRVFLDGRPVENALDTDLGAGGRTVVREQRTYQLIRTEGGISDRVVEIEFLDGGVEAYCFTFG